MAIDLSMPVLVVEDSRTMSQIVRNLLMLIGFKHVDNVFDVDFTWLDENLIHVASSAAKITTNTMPAVLRIQG